MYSFTNNSNSDLVKEAGLVRLWDGIIWKSIHQNQSAQHRCVMRHHQRRQLYQPVGRSQVPGYMKGTQVTIKLEVTGIVVNMMACNVTCEVVEIIRTKD